MKWLTNPYVLVGGGVLVVYFLGRSRFLDVCKAQSANPGNCPRLLSLASPWDLFAFGLGINKGGVAGQAIPTAPPDADLIEIG